MAGAFQLLRSNDLIWSRLINGYMQGRPEMGNDLMAWNADGTRLPARMQSENLRRLFLNNDLAEGRLLVAGERCRLQTSMRRSSWLVRVPITIAPWRSVHKIHLLNEGDITFVLTSGGHNAGIISEPGHPHRAFRMRHRAAGERYVGPDERAASADRHEGSRWSDSTRPRRVATHLSNSATNEARVGRVIGQRPS
jgi:polyhydroxyalkanoate synthase subunit PhaC